MKKGVLLIGMPGAGKNNHRKKRSFNGIKDEFLDMDEFIERSTGKRNKRTFCSGEKRFLEI